MIKKAITILTIVALLLSLTVTSSFAVSTKKIPNTTVKADSRVVNAFVDLGFKVKYNKSHKYAGTFSVAKHSITMKTKTKSHILHEMGHFVSEINDATGTSSQFKKIFNAEKKKYKGSQKKYITSNSEEYFAQSFAEYTSSPSALKKSRPKTYNYIKSKVAAIDDDAVQEMYDAYSWAW